VALTPLQRRIYRLLAEERRRSGESYVAGGGALNELLAGRRLSQDVDLFHDTEAAVAATFPRDRDVLAAAGLAVTVVQRSGPAYLKAEVSDEGESVLVEWTQDSAYRFFPLLEHPELGLTLHPFDLATNKVLALVGRREARDFIDVLQCHVALQPLGYLAWAAAGKDPGFGPLDIVEEAASRSRYTQPEIDALAFDGVPPSAADLSRRWHVAVAEARELVRTLPAEEAGTCVLDAGVAAREVRFVKSTPQVLAAELRAGRVLFHDGAIRGAFPRVRSS